MTRSSARQTAEPDATRARIEQAVRNTVARQALWTPGEPVLVAVSGGADSLCLLGTLLALQEHKQATAPGEIIVAHLNHRLRGTESEADAAWVAAHANGLGLRCVLGESDVAAIAHAGGHSLEDAARRARYDFLRRAAAEVGACRICVGHTHDDQVETLIMHWLRGSGLDGLAGMPYLAGDIARPLLDLTRDDTVAYCRARSWEQRNDPTNADPAFLRNRIRHELLPQLERLNPNLRQTLGRNAALIADDARYIQSQADLAWCDTLTSRTDNTLALDLAEMRTIPAALRHRLLRRAARDLLPPDIDQVLEARHIVLLDRLIASGRTGAALTLPGGLHVTRDYTTLVFSTAPAAGAAGVEPAEPSGVSAPPRSLSVPGIVELPEIGWRIRAWQTELPPGSEGGPAPDPQELPAFATGGTYGSVGHAEMRVYLDADSAGTALTVRTWLRGDRFRPLGMRHDKKVQDYFTDAKVPRAVRARLPLIFNERHLLWLAGLRIDDRARLTSHTRHILVLQAEVIDHLTNNRGTHADLR